jgi:L-histidine N-alpha-methyltransferase
MSGANVFIDRSQFPEALRRDLIDSLRARAINHKFHYESYKQAAKWLALHEAYSPARCDPSCLRIYDDAFTAAAASLKMPHVHLVGLGCGGGQKEARLLEPLRERHSAITCTLSDVSLPLVLTAREAALRVIGEPECHAAICDLGTTNDLSRFTNDIDSSSPRIITLFGIVPNFEPDPLLCRLNELLRPTDLLLLSANLSPGFDYARGVEAVLPQYDNALTHDWLLTLLLDLGFERDDGELNFAIETDAGGLRRITAHFELKRGREVRVYGETISFDRGERIRLFFSYRHTPETMRLLLDEHGIPSTGQWLNDAGDEGVFLCGKA